MSEEDYAHAKKVFDKLKCRNMLDYCEIYCSLDTLLLGEAINAYRKLMIESYSLDPVYFFGVPSFSFACMMYQINEPLEIFSDIDMCEFIRKGLRGGPSFINTKIATGIKIS